MKVNATNIRRFTSGISLTVALSMLVLGLTLFSERFSKIDFAIYWLICFLLTGLAAITALIDMALLRRKLREEQRDLIASTLAESQADQARNPSQKK